MEVSLIIGENVYKKIQILTKENELVASITDEEVIEEEDYKVVYLQPKKVKLSELIPGTRIPEGAEIEEEDSEDSVHQEKHCHNEEFLNIIAKMACDASYSSQNALTISIVSIILSLVHIILHFV